MSTSTAPEVLVDSWRSDAGPDNPAGPLFTSGRWAETDLQDAMLGVTCSACTASRTQQCC
jgi:hypothetical protein